MAADGKKILACAIYTRKSSEEGLEQEFNSLDAQREACEAYISSQRHEGWRVVATQYDDGGFSGGNMDRPALAKLMDDIRARKVKVVVVYKVDRLTRALSDFAKIVDVFDAQGVSFVSVTQHFNTTTSMGRLTLNVLLSFAQFEREVSGERIRDKIAASKKKGMFMGGNLPLGYDLKDHRLVVNEAEANAVRAIFSLYAELRSVRRLQAEVARLGIVTKLRVGESGRKWGGKKWSRGNLYYFLRNHTYLGETFHKGQVYPGQHDAIVDRGLWEKVQETLAGNARARSDGKGFAHPSPLTGLLFDDLGNRLTPSHTQKGSVRYRYYVCQPLLHHQPEKAGPIKRVPAAEIENLIAEQVRALLTDSARLIGNLVGDEATGEMKEAVLSAAAAAAAKLDQQGKKEALSFARKIVRKITIKLDAVEIVFDRPALKKHLGLIAAATADSSAHGNGDNFTVIVSARLTRSGRQKSLVISEKDGAERLVNTNMVRAIAKAVTWDQEIRRGASLREIAKRNNVDAGYVTRLMPLAFLAPDIVQAIYDGKQPVELKMNVVRINLPLEWAEQRRKLGFPAR